MVPVDTAKGVHDVFVGEFRAAPVIMAGMNQHVTCAQHASEFPVTGHHRKASDLAGSHGVQSGMDIVVRTAYVKILGHHLSYFQLRGSPVLGAQGNTDIAVRDDADHILRRVHHRQGAAPGRLE